MTAGTGVSSEMDPTEIARLSMWLRTRTKSKKEGMKMRVPPAEAERRSAGMRAVVKYLKRASGSVEGVGESKRENVCFVSRGGERREEGEEGEGEEGGRVPGGLGAQDRSWSRRVLLVSSPAHRCSACGS